LSSSSSSSELSCATSVKVGTLSFAPSVAPAFGVPSGDGVLELGPWISFLVGDVSTVAGVSGSRLGAAGGLDSEGGVGLGGRR